MSFVDSRPTVSASMDDQTALITGAAGAIGWGIAEAMAAVGAQVVLADIDADALAHRADSLASDSALPIATDLADPQARRDLIDSAVRWTGRLDVLVNCAAIGNATPLLQLALDDWKRTFEVNVEAPFELMRMAALHMVEQPPNPATGCRGKIINVSSRAAEHGRPLLAQYGASKAALNHLTKSSAAALADQLIAATVLYPGNVIEGLVGRLASGLAAAEGANADSFLEERRITTPLGRHQTPDEVADIAVFIATARGMSLNGCAVYSEPSVIAL